MKYRLGQIVYHEDIYDYKEPLKIIGIKSDKLELEGDYSGGTHNTKQSDWLSIEGVSTIYKYGYKKKCREYATTVAAITIPKDIEKNSLNETINELVNMILELTNDVK
jgi:hypothetical protein